MKTFQCDNCQTLVFFENDQCMKCGSALGFLPDVLDMSALKPTQEGRWLKFTTSAAGARYRACANGEQNQVCNWMVPADDPNPFCRSCRLNEIIPDLSVAGNRERWHKLELAKRRCVYALLRLGLPINDMGAENLPALRFRFLGDAVGHPRVMTGHKDGIITVNITEADDDERERRRLQMHEPYRTLVGHLRHELGHYYWDRLIANSPQLSRFRELFGDQSDDYPSALQKYHQDGPAENWARGFITAYASVHPWEDWAETWAHYLHMVDSLETAFDFGLSLRRSDLDENPERESRNQQASFDEMLRTWVWLTCALNAVNRGMGLPDLYPFVIPEPAVEKLRFVHSLVQNTGFQTEVGEPEGESAVFLEQGASIAPFLQFVGKQA